MTKPIDAPAGFVPEQAIAFADTDGSAAAVAAARPLPVAATLTAATATPLAGTATGATTAGPFAPQLGRVVWVTLSGSWAGTVQLLRSTDGGVTRLPLTTADGSAKGQWTGPVNAPVVEESVATATYWLAVALQSGALTYRVEQ